jgi:transcriptional regulator with XRE-family HTH domain
VERKPRRRDPTELARFGDNLRAARERAGLSQDALSRRCALHTTEISRIERAVTDPKVSTVLEAARGLGIPAGELFDGLPLTK